MDTQATVNNAIEIRVITEDMVEESLEFLKTNFYPHEPVRRSLENGGPYFVDRFTKNYIGKGYSIAAVDTSTNQIVGIRIGKVVTADDWVGRAMNSLVGRKAMCLLNDVTHTPHTMDIYYQRRQRLGFDVYRLMDRLKAKRVYVGSGVCTAPTHRAAGLATKLVAKSIEVAKEDGCEYMYLTVSGNFSAKLYDRLGFSVEGELDYDTFVDEKGERLLKDTREHTKSQVRLKKLE